MSSTNIIGCWPPVKLGHTISKYVFENEVNNDGFNPIGNNIDDKAPSQQRIISMKTLSLSPKVFVN